MLTSSKEVFGGLVAKTFMTARKDNLSLLLVGAAITVLVSWPKATLAAENEGSLETIWTETAKSPGNETKISEAIKTPASSSHVKGVCPVAPFLNSEIVVTGGWPGVGPFKAQADHPYDFIDAAQNHLNLSVDNEQVTAAQMELVNSKESLLKLQLSTDFLLESLGVKPAKINDFNLSFEKETAQLKGSLAGPILLNSGPVAVLSKPLESNQADSGEPGNQKSGFKVIVNARQSSPKERSASAKRVASDGSQSENIGLTAMNSSPTSAKATDNDGKNAQTNETISSGKSALGSNEKPETNAAAAGIELKKEFLSVIQNWQVIKKAAVREGQTSQLSEVLAGKALARQIDAIKWLSANHKYLDITPKGTTVERLEEITPDQKYAVHAVVKENTKYIDQKSGQLLKEIKDIYHVIYAMERINDHWFISDTTIVKTDNPGQPPAKVQH